MVSRMDDIPYIQKISPKMKALMTILILFFVGVLIGYVLSFVSLQIILEEINKLPINIDQSRINRSINSYTAAIIFLTIQITLLIGLFYVYFDSFRKTKSQFLIGLNMFIIALLVRSVLSIISLHKIATDYVQVIPYISRTFLTPGLGLLDFVVYLFEITAISILLYISMK